MPYDPDWVSEGEAPNEPADPQSASWEEGSDEFQTEEEAEQQDQNGEQRRDNDGFDDADDMDVDLPLSVPSQHTAGDQDAAPGNRPHHEVAVPGKGTRLEVVLHSSPRSDVFTVPAADFSGNSGDEVDLVTSDIVPKSTSKRHDDLAAKAPAAPPPRAPPVAAAPFPAVTPQPKKKGRPFGWRLGSGPYSAMRAGLAPVSSTPRPKLKKPASEQKPGRRRGRNPAPTARQIYLKLNPRFAPFHCEWENCPAELQNLETLRRHLLIVHGRPPPSTTSAATASSPRLSSPSVGGLTCGWANCPLGRPSEGENPLLPSHEAFAAHIETAHLAAFVWHIGDGPRNSNPPFSSSSPSRITSTTNAATTTTTSSTAPLPHYLFDARGNQVTPSVRDQQVENEDDRKRRAARVSRVLQQRDANAPEEPQYGAAELAEMAAFMSAKRARQRMFEEYAARVQREEEKGRGRGEVHT